MIGRAVMATLVALAGCGERQGKTTRERNEASDVSKGSEGKTMTKEQIIEIAQQDAATKYRDLTIYDVTATQVGTEWHVVYSLKDDSDGGGPEYKIDQQGKIVSKKYYQ